MQKINLKKLQYCLAITALGISSEVLAVPYYDNGGAQRSYLNHRINAVRPRPISSNITPQFNQITPKAPTAPQPFKPNVATPTTPQPTLPQQPTSSVNSQTIPSYNNPKTLTNSATQTPIVNQPSAPIMTQPQTNPYSQITQATQPPKANQPAAAQPTQSPDAKQLGWQQYIPPEMRNLKPDPAFTGRIYTGYRIDNGEWNVAGDLAGQNPPKLSELTFDSVNMVEVGGEAAYTHREGPLKGAHIEASLQTTKGISGETTDSDFRNAVDDNGVATGELEEFSRSVSANDDSDAHGYKIAAGYEIRMDSADNKTKAWITPIIGYSVHNINFNMQDGEQIIPATGAFQGLDSNYEMEWNGGFAGIVGGFRADSHMVNFRGELHATNFDGTGEWNLRPTFNQPVSFVNSGNGIGFEFGGDYNYLFEESGWGLFAGLHYRSFSIEDGIDTVIFSDGTTSSQKLNEVSWTSALGRAGARYSF